jgi:hypothetical protein
LCNVNASRITSGTIGNQFLPSVISTSSIGIGTSSPRFPLHVIGDTFVYGTITSSNLNVIGDTVIMNTYTSNTEKMVINNAGTGPALDVIQTGFEPIARFLDDEDIALIITDGSYVGIGTAVPLAKTHIYHEGTGDILRVDDQSSPDGTPFIIAQNGNVGVGTNNPLYNLHVEGNAYAKEVDTNVLFTSSVSETSDVRYKKDIQQIADPLSTIQSLRGVTFTWCADERRDIGMIAQEVECVLPELVSQRYDGTKSIAYSHIVGLLIEAVKEQQRTIDDLKNKVTSLQQAINGGSQ